MPLRRVVSQSETISAPCQCRTLRRGLEAVYGPYSTSAPCTMHSTTRDDTEHERGRRLNSPSRPCRQGHEGCDLNSVNETEITQRRAVFDGEGNRSLPTTGRGEGVRPHARVHRRSASRPFRRKSTLWSCQRTLLRPCRPLLLNLLSINKYRLDPCYGQAPFEPCYTFVTFEKCYSC